MNLSEYMQKDLVFLNIEANTKKDLFERIVASMAQNKIIDHPGAFLDELMQREDKAPTCIGRGIALPHTRTQFVDRPIIAFARLNSPINFSQNPKDSVQLVFLMGTPAADPNTYLKILADLCTQLRDSKFRDKLLHARKRDQILQLLSMSSS